MSCGNVFVIALVERLFWECLRMPVLTRVNCLLLRLFCYIKCQHTIIIFFSLTVVIILLYYYNALYYVEVVRCLLALTLYYIIALKLNRKNIKRAIYMSFANIFHCIEYLIYIGSGDKWHRFGHGSRIST